MLRNCFLILFLFLGIQYSNGQNLQKMQIWEDSLFNIGQKVFSNISEVEKIESNFLFVRTLVAALKEPNSYFFNFEHLKMISSVRSPDDNFRIFSWNIPLQDGSFLYYGSIQKKSGTLNLIPLLDKTFEIDDVDKAVLNNNQWYGAQYYEIVPYQQNKYILLGWKGHDSHNTQKIIEVLNFLPDGKIKLGDHIFLDNTSISRKIFTYAKEAKMLLSFQPRDKRIIFDHLVPLEGAKNQKNVPDLSHDAYLLDTKGLKLQTNVLVLNFDE